MSEEYQFVSINNEALVSVGPKLTYRVVQTLGENKILSHSLTPSCLIVKPDRALKEPLHEMPSEVERAIRFAMANESLLGFTALADLKAISYFLVIEGYLSGKQRGELSNICGKIASVKLANNLLAAGALIQKYRPLLDDYNTTSYNAVKHLIDNPRMEKCDKNQRFTIFNLAGFIQAQLD